MTSNSPEEKLTEAAKILAALSALRNPFDPEITPDRYWRSLSPDTQARYRGQARAVLLAYRDGAAATLESVRPKVPETISFSQLPSRPQTATPRVDHQADVINTTLYTAAEQTETGVLTTWEEQFVQSNVEKLERDPNWTPTERQEAIILRIREKLEAKGLM